MSRLLNLDEKDAVRTLLSVRSHRKRPFESDDSESSYSVSQCGTGDSSPRPSNGSSNAAESTSKEHFQFQHIIELDLTMGKPAAIKKKMVCECGAIILVRTDWKHKQSNKHIQFMLRKQQQGQQGSSGASGVPIQEQQRPPQQQQKQKRNRSSPRANVNVGAVVGGPPTNQEVLRERQPQPPARPSNSNGHPGSRKMHDAAGQQPQREQHSDLGAPSILPEIYSRLQQPPVWRNGFGSSGHNIDLGQPSILRASDGMGTSYSPQGPSTAGICIAHQHQELRDHNHFRIDLPSPALSGRPHALGFSELLLLRQQQPLWFIAAPPTMPLHHQQQWHWTAPETGLFDRDYSASLSNFPNHSFYY